MTKKRITTAVVAACLALISGSLAVYLASAAPHGAFRSVRMVSTAPSLLPTTGASAIVDASNAFLATLSPKQRTVAEIDLTPANAARWSNFPAGFSPRNGVFFRDLNAAQSAAALKVARLALSPEGLARFQEVRATDDYFAKHDTGPGGPRPGGNGGPPPGGFRRPGGGFGGPPPPGGFHGPGGPPQGAFGGPGGGNLFGSGNYMIAFLGSPSMATPWLLQLGGHHVAFNIFYKGKTGTSTPYFVGAQPIAWKDANGKTHRPLASMRNAMYALINSLNPAQLTKARLDDSFSDVYVGPGRDGQFPSRQGVLVSQLSPVSKHLVKEAIAAWTGDTAQAQTYRNLYGSELNETAISYSGTTALSGEGDYVRIDGPRVWIEFCCQASDHYHTIWRDRKTDYGAEFSFGGQ